MTTTTDTSPAVIPDFGDDAEERKICFICSKGNLDMAYPALIMAMINLGTWKDLQFSMLGNTAMHMPGSSRHIPQGLGGLPGMTSYATKMLKEQIAELDIPEIPEFLQMLHDMGARFWACKLSVDMMGLTKEDMWEGVEDIINVNEFMEISEGAQVLFI
jgi:peroxiredoxin family protein